MSHPVGPRMRHVLSALFATWMVLLLYATAWAERVNQITLLHFGDIYEILPQQETGGFAPLMTLIQRARDRHPHTLLTFGGDLLSPSVISYLSQGKEMVSLCNALGIDLAVLGNHEFDFGPVVLAKRIEESRFQWLASNVRVANDRPFPGTKLTAIREMNGIKVGFIGLLIEPTGALIDADNPVNFLDPIAIAEALIPQLKQQGAEMIVALTHQTTAEDKNLAREVAGLDIILGGHDHKIEVLKSGKTLIVKTASEGRYLAEIALTVIRPEVGEKGILRIIPDVHLMSSFRIPPEASVQAIVTEVDNRLRGGLDRVVGRTSTELDSREETVRQRESTMGNLFADAIQAESQADAVIFNGGGLRGNRLYPAGSTLTYGDIFKESPFGNTIVLLEISEQTLWQALEHGISQVGMGRFPQVAGLSLTYDPRRPPGNRILELYLGKRHRKTARLNRRGTRMYRLGTNDYLARGGDGYHMLVGAKRLISAEAGKPLSTVVMNFLTQKGTVSYRAEKRLTAIKQR